MVDAAHIADRLQGVRSRIESACRKAGRADDAVTLVAVTKTVDLDEIRALSGLGVTHFGENRVHELARKATSLTDLDVRWHMIGHLQRNKVARLLPHSTIVHSLDSDRLAGVLSRRADEMDLDIDVLIEVNVAGEEAKYGVRPEAAAALAEAVTSLGALKLRGLMTMAPFLSAGEDPERLRPIFAGLRELAQTLSKNLPEDAMSELSMGMTQDFEVAVEEGATLVRIGSALFS